MQARHLLVPALLAVAVAAHAQVTVSDAWVRGTVAQQTTTGMFFTITSAQGGRLVGVATPVAHDAQLHEMTMKGDLMMMRPVAAIALPPGKPVQLAPNGLHVMLTGLSHPLAAGQTVPATLTVEDAQGKRQTVQVQSHVEALGATHASGASAPMSGMGSMSMPMH